MLLDCLAWSDSPYSFPTLLYHPELSVRSPSPLSMQSPTPITSSQPGGPPEAPTESYPIRCPLQSVSGVLEVEGEEKALPKLSLSTGHPDITYPLPTLGAVFVPLCSASRQP